MRAPGDEPQFGRLIEEVERARKEWHLGNRGRAEGILKVVASIAFGEAFEQRPNDPIPEVRRNYR
jgi:hypothetical protein